MVLIIFLSLVLSIITLGYVFYRLKNKRFNDLASKIPGPDGLPFIANAFAFAGSAQRLLRSFTDLTNSYGPAVRFWAGHRCFVLLSNPADIEVILGSQIHLDKSPEYRYFAPWLGNGLLISTGDHWRSHRKLIAPTFHFNVLKSYMGLFNRNARDVCAQMVKHKDEQFDCHSYMSACTVETLLETVMGINKKTYHHNGFVYAEAVMEMCKIIQLRQIRPWLYFDQVYFLTLHKWREVKLLDKIHSLTQQVIKQKQEERKKGVERNLAVEFELDKPENEVEVDDIGEKKRVSFLDLMIESAQNGLVLNDNDLREEVDTIMFEGHDTAASASSFFLAMMACFPEIQDRVFQEMEEIFGVSDRPCTFRDTLEMKYLERCLMETLRMYPPVPFIARQINEEVKLPGTGYTLPAGMTVVLLQYLVHRDPAVYPDPKKFDPDNFLPERVANRNYYSFIPFSAGPRSCIGRKYVLLKLKVILSTIIRAFKVKSTLNEKDFMLQDDIILKREEGFLISLERRKGKEGLLQEL